MTTTDSTYTLKSISEAVPAPSAEAIELFSVTLSPAELVAMGARVSSSKILTDAIRWAGQVAHFVQSAPPEQLAAIGLSPLQLGVFVHAIGELDKRNKSRGGGTEATDDARQRDRADAAQKELAGKQERDQLDAILANAALGEPGAVKAVAVAFGTAPDVNALTTSLRQLGKLGVEWLRGGGKPGRRLKAAGLTDTRFTAAATLADAVDTAAKKAAGAGVQGEVTQAQLDEQDGRVLSHMDALRDLFAAAHDHDLKVPKLFPIATRSFFVRSHRAKSQAANAPEPANV